MGKLAPRAPFKRRVDSGIDVEDSCAKRMQALRRYQILDSPPESSFDDIAKLASELCKAPFAAISFVAAEREWFKSTIGLSVCEKPISHSFCAHTIDQAVPLIIPDTLEDKRFRDNELVNSAPHLRFYAGFPLLASDGTPLGALCVFDDAPRDLGLSASETSALSILATQVQAQLELRAAILERDAQVERLSALTQNLRHVGGHDALTMLPNRALFAETLGKSIEASQLTGSSLALLLVDVDHFKQINDSLGHDAGDALLRRFAANLRSVVRASDTVARIGGDEFAVLLTGKGAAEPLTADVLASLSNRLAKPIRHRGRSIAVQASIGVALFPTDARCSDDLVKCSDLALAEAKKLRNKAISYTPDLKDDFDLRNRMASEVRSALAASELSPFYQPKIGLDSGAVEGFEALMRRQRNGRILPVPNPFDLDFSDRRLAAKVGLDLAMQVLDDMQRWLVAGIQFGHVAINSCAADFAGGDFAESLLREMERRNLPPRLVELEVTEGVFIGRGASHVAQALDMLSNAGMRIALDDFGTGYASLSHLKQFPVDVLKIDRSFVAGIGRNADDTAIVRAVIGLGRNLGMEVVAEGVETSDQEAFVRMHGCNVGQGFFYGAAMSASDVMSMRSLSLRQPKRAA